MGEEPGAMNPDTGPRADTVPAADDPTVIRAEIAQTRAEMSETIEAIQDRLSPQRVMEQAKETVRDATVGRIKDMANSVSESAGGVATQVQEGAQQAVEYVRQNPWPALLIGAGVTWMLLQTQRSQPRPMYQSSSPSRGPGEWRQPSSSASMKGTVGDMTGKVQERWQEYSTRAETEFQRWMRQNPLTVGAAAVALGAAVGLSAPRTDTEDAWMGEARDAALDRAQDVAQETVQQVQKVVDEAQDTVQQAPQTVGGTGSSAGSASRA